MFDYWVAHAGRNWTAFVLIILPLAVAFIVTIWVTYFRSLPGYSLETAQRMRKGSANLTILAAFIALFSIALPLFAHR
jgi:hypothetical protein